MPILLLIRHGENDYLKKGRMPGRAPDIHLNEAGRKQAAALAQALSGLPVKAIISSPLERAVETAETIAGALGLKIELRPGLMDTDVGDWQGKEIKALRKKPAWKIVQGAPSRMQFPGGESFLELQVRVVKEIESLCAAHRKQMIVVVFHADPIKLAIAHYIGLQMDHFQKLTVDPGSVSLMAIGESGARLLALNLKPPFELHFPKFKS
jgi:probable phosphoglycerate mutase